MYGPGAAIGEPPDSQAPRRDTRRPADAHAFAQQIAAFYPYPSPTPARPDDPARTDAARGPAAASRYPGLAQRRHGRGAG
ncbi:MAG: hypothetical protein CALGDGBN_00653 [Pseudomonadales bacterium]|nr:hypothetical protein [Pseudomonadales bacterium]